MNLENMYDGIYCNGLNACNCNKIHKLFGILYCNNKNT